MFSLMCVEAAVATRLQTVSRWRGLDTTHQPKHGESSSYMDSNTPKHNLVRSIGVFFNLVQVTQHPMCIILCMVMARHEIVA